MSEQIKSDLEVVLHKKIYFGHKSVGNNIINGIKEIASEYESIKINIVDIDSSEISSDFYFAHSAIGTNREPNTKCDAFLNVLDKKMAKLIEIAILKFCFADINENSNVNAIFQYYRQTIDSIKVKYPHLTIVHVTVPLVAGSKGLKKQIKRLFNIEDWSDPGNIKRGEFNKLLLETYKDETIFDLAKVESTYLDGKRENFNKNGKEYYSLINKYSNDGAHLNSIGSQRLAIELIKTLANISAN